MKRFLALLLLFCGAAHAQQIDYTYTQTYVGAPAPFQQLNVNQGTPLNLADDQVSNPINLGFNFKFYGQDFNSAFISSNGVLGFQGPINGCCSGYNLANPGNRYGIFALQTDLINLQTTNPWYRTQGEQGDRTFTVGWYNMPIYYDQNFRSSFEITLFENNNNILLNYGDLNTNGRFFTAGIKGNDGEYELIYSGTNDAFLENSSYMFSFIPPPPPIPEFLYWINLATENGVFTLTTAGVVRYGASGVYTYAELQQGTYSCSNGSFGDPIPGVYKSCEFGSNIPPVVEVDCSVTPGDISCLIEDGIIDYTDPEELLASLEDDDFTNTGDDGIDNGSDDGSDSGSDDGSEIDSTEDTTDSFEEDFGSVDEEVISEEEESEDITESDAMEELIAEQELEELLSIEEMQDSIEEGDDEKEENEEKLADSIDPSILSLVLSIVESTSIVDNSGATAGAASSTTAAAAIGAGGALNNTATVTTSSRTESASNFSIDAANESLNEATQFAATESQTNTNINAETNAALGLVTDSLRDAENLVASSAITEETVATNKTNESAFDDNTETDLPVMTLDPNNPLSQFFNSMPSLANLEAAGALNNKQDKSDAEVRAEQVVAANQEEQEAINANYMEADQAGIVAAIGADVDVSSYRTAMLNDNNIWYKPEDIYKGVIIKDNVRGSYFLEKGNTDTYKKMVEEQYK
jgi:hypothetical protein